MRLHRLVLSNEDYQKLVMAVEEARRMRSVYLPHLDLFRTQLNRATVVSPGEVPGDLITMHSRFELSGEGPGESSIHTLVYPDEAWHDGLSVLSAMGRALLGARVGQEVSWLSSRGRESAKVLHLLKQPEWHAACAAAPVAAGV